MRGASELLSNASGRIHMLPLDIENPPTYYALDSRAFKGCSCISMQREIVMALKAEVKQLLDRNRSAVPEAVRARNSQAMRLNLGGRNIMLVNASGRLTEAGKFFYQKLRNEPVPDARWDDAVT